MQDSSCDYPESISFIAILKDIETLSLGDGDVLNMLNLISKNEYKRLRKDLNGIFRVGEPSPVFLGPLGIETEFGDFTDLIQMSILEQYPPEMIGDTIHTFSLGVDERKKMRDTMLKFIDTKIQE